MNHRIFAISLKLRRQNFVTLVSWIRRNQVKNAPGLLLVSQLRIRPQSPKRPKPSEVSFQWFDALFKSRIFQVFFQNLDFFNDDYNAIFDALVFKAFLFRMKTKRDTKLSACMTAKLAVLLSDWSIEHYLELWLVKSIILATWTFYLHFSHMCFTRFKKWVAVLNSMIL